VTEFDRADKRMLTLRQCLTCTSGLPARLSGRLRGFDMAKFAAAAADTGLRQNPGSSFIYGGTGFQIAAVAAERVTGKSWHELFASRVGKPLGMTQTKFGALKPVGADAGTTELPWVAGGAVSSLADYERFVLMLLGGGEVAGRRVLKADSVDLMLRDQIEPRVVVHSEFLVGDHLRYGLGTWIEELGNDVVRVSDPGAFGFTPWLDRDLGIGGVFAVRDRVRRVLPKLRSVQDVAREVVLSPVVAGTESSHTVRHGGRDRRYLLHVPPHDDSQPAMPLLVVLHGGGGNGAQVRANTGIAEIATRAGFAVAFPDGSGLLPKRLLTWNSGGIDVYASRNDVDDVGFLREVVRDVGQRVPIDAARVYAAGHSNGGMMCHRLAREAADVFSGIAVVAGAMNFTDADATSPIAVMIVHGAADKHVLYRGGKTEVTQRGQAGRVDASVQDAIDYYVARNNLSGYPRSESHDDVRVDDYGVPKDDRPTAPVRVVSLEHGGHSWPGSSQRPRLIADTPVDYPASRAIVEFFASLQPAASSPTTPGGKKQQTPAVPR
jgi:polyhydroxybutyrate depolymerase